MGQPSARRRQQQRQRQGAWAGGSACWAVLGSHNSRCVCDCVHAALCPCAADCRMPRLTALLELDRTARADAARMLVCTVAPCRPQLHDVRP